MARISSPLSNDRSYQEVFLDALKEYFDDGKVRLLKMGDLIAVPIKGGARRSSNEEEAEDAPKQDNPYVPVLPQEYVA